MVRNKKFRVICHLLILIIIMTVGVVAVNATDYYEKVVFSYSDGVPSNLFAIGGLSDSLSFENVNYGDGSVLFYRLEASSCFKSFKLSEMNKCIQKYKIDGNIIPSNGVVIRYTGDLNKDSKFLTAFYASGDSYPVHGRYIYGLPISVINKWGYSYNPNPVTVSFSKQNGGVAEIQELNIKNLDNPLKPVQIEVPVKVSQTVCSALRRATKWDTYDNIPSGYSDFNADTRITLTIKDVNTNNQIKKESIVIPIRAETCAGLGAFSWTPSSDMENQKVKFIVETEVIDNQIKNAQKDEASVIERVYPSDLGDSCWARSYDFKLVNVPSDKISVSIAQYTKGEYLYAISKNGAFKGNNIIPINYELILRFNDQNVYDRLFTTSSAVTENDLNLNIINMTDVVKNLPTGVYNVTLITRPIASGCSNIDVVEQSQKLIVLGFTNYHMIFNVVDENDRPISGAGVNLKLLKAKDYFVEEPVYDRTLITTVDGVADFDDVLAGSYSYTVAYGSFLPSRGKITINGNRRMTIKLNSHNFVPVIGIPKELQTYYRDPLVINLKDYVYDTNDDFDSLVFSAELITGSGSAIWDPVKDTLTFTADVPNNASFKVTVMDPYGGVASEIVNVYFNGNHAPSIVTFNASPDNGQAPLRTAFTVLVSDEDNDHLTCTLDFGDGMNVTKTCSELDGFEHVYNNINTYVAHLFVTDGNANVTAEKLIYVYNRTETGPIVNYFRLVSSGNFVPTNLTLSWNVTHRTNLSMNCYLRVNGVQEEVNCIGNRSFENFNRVGISRFHIIAIDSNNTQVVRSIVRTFYNNESVLSAINIRLVVSDTLTPGKFNFGIETTNETLARRTVMVKPIIDCGYENIIKYNDGFLTTMGVSKAVNDLNRFDFIADTNDYVGTVPVDTLCKLRVIVKDDLGSEFELSKDVVFKYPVPNRTFKSITGRGTEIMDYMSSTLTSGISTGYNTISFDVVNNEDSVKDLSITVIASDIGLSIHEEYNLGPGETKRISLPLLISDDVDAGRYPIRYSIRFGNEKLTKYSYILVN